MARKEKAWLPTPAKKSKLSLPDSIKAEVEAKATHLIEKVLKPKHVKPPRKDEQFNYVIDIGAKWYRHYFYFYSTYACPSTTAISPTFESRFARMEFIGNAKFSLAYMCHTGEWFGMYDALSVDNCMAAIQNDPWFSP